MVNARVGDSARAIPGVWQPLDGASGVDVVLAVDFESARPDRGLTALLGPFAGQVPVLRLRTDALPVGPGGQGLVADWVDGLRQSRLRPRLIVGYCAGGAPACAIAEAWGADAPPVILLDPETVDDRTISHEVGAALEQLADFLPATDRERTVAEARRTCREQDGPTLVRTLVQRYQESGRPVFAELAVDAQAEAALCARLASYLVFLVTARSLGYSDRSVTRLLLSAHHDPPATVTGPIERFPVIRAGLLDDPGVRAAVAAAIEAADL